MQHADTRLKAVVTVRPKLFPTLSHAVGAFQILLVDPVTRAVLRSITVSGLTGGMQLSRDGSVLAVFGGSYRTSVVELYSVVTGEAMGEHWRWNTFSGYVVSRSAVACWSGVLRERSGGGERESSNAFFLAFATILCLSALDCPRSAFSWSHFLASVLCMSFSDEDDYEHFSYLKSAAEVDGGWALVSHFNVFLAPHVASGAEGWLRLACVRCPCTHAPMHPCTHAPPCTPMHPHAPMHPRTHAPTPHAHHHLDHLQTLPSLSATSSGCGYRTATLMKTHLCLSSGWW